MNTVAVVGLGVMGGSVARALRAGCPGVQIVGWDLDEAQLAAAGAAGALDRSATSARQAVAGADVVLLAVHLGALAQLLADIVPGLGGDALVMDVASLQCPALAAGGAAGIAHRHVSAHPLAGSERSGFAGSRPDLYDGAPVTLSVAGSVPEPRRRELIRRATAFWAALSARPSEEEAEAHDHRMALVSHLPQLVSNALAMTLAAAGVDPSQLGPGGRDMTRLSGSDPTLWGDLLEHSGSRVAAALRSVANESLSLAEALEEGDLSTVQAVMNRTRSWRNG